MDFFVRIYMRVCKKERKYTWQKNARISYSRNDCKYTWEKPHVYRVIILKQMGDHRKEPVNGTTDNFSGRFSGNFAGATDRLECLKRFFCFSGRVPFLQSHP